MLHVLRHLNALSEFCLRIPSRILRWLMSAVAFHPKLGPLRHLFSAAAIYVVFALLLVYVVAPIRGYLGDLSMRDKLGYDAERWLATAIYDPKGNFIGTFDPRLDSLRDVNYTGSPIDLGDYVANPDHKSIPVREVPEQYWRCLSYHEDRYLGSWLNPFGIDLAGVLKIPITTITNSIAAGRPMLGVGGSTLPMQFARVIYKTPPSPNEGSLEKLRRKFGEWWLAPVIYRDLTRNGDDTLLRQWAANHIWLAQRTGGQPLHGVEVTSQVVFGKEAKDLTTAEQFVLASAVNKPIILLEGNDRLNAVRLDRWRYITEVRARTCAEKLITDEAEQRKVVFELMALAGGPPDPKVKPKLEATLERFVPGEVKRAEANPVIRANLLLPGARFGIREEMKQRYGFGWRDYVRGVTTTFDAGENLAFRNEIDTELATLDAKWTSRIDPDFTLDPKKANADKTLPNIIVVAADADGRIVRYYETGETAAYFGSTPARNRENGLYDPKLEGRQVASTGKMLLAIALANQGRDTAESLYSDPKAPSSGLDTCAKGAMRQPRKAIVAFACSLNAPLIARGAALGQAPIKRLIDRFGFAMPPAATTGGTPPSTAVVLGQIAGAPRRVHFMSSVILASLIGRGGRAVRQPTLIKAYDYTQKGRNGGGIASEPSEGLIPNSLIRARARGLIKTLLGAPLCYQTGGKSYGTLQSLAKWCAQRRSDVRLHFAKTGTSVTLDPDATVDTLATGGLQFANGAAYSYVVLVGTGNASRPWARHLHAAQIAAPLLDVLLRDLARDAKSHARRDLVSHRRPVPTATTQTPAKELAAANR
jgi:membrane peptidoglycan carboxypeptidase